MYLLAIFPATTSSLTVQVIGARRSRPPPPYRSENSGRYASSQSPE